MKTLLVMRHAKSSWSDDRLADHDRPLNERGRRDAPRMGRLLAEQGLAPDAILCSSAVRARDTAELVAEESGAEAPAVRPMLYGGDVADYLAALRRLPDEVDVALVVGHNPTVSELVDALADADEAMPTAAVAHVALPLARWADLDEDAEGRLAAVWRPRELPAG